MSMLYKLRRLPVPNDVVLSPKADDAVPKSRLHVVLDSSEWDAADKWAVDMASVVASLRLAMTQTVRNRVQSAVTVDELWDELDERFGTRSHGERTRLLRELVRTDMVEGEDAMAFSDRMDDICDRGAPRVMLDPGTGGRAP